MPPQDIPTEVKSCKAIADDKERLRCFDGLFGGPSKPQKTTEEEQVKNPPEEEHANWSIDETKSPADGSTQVVAANLVGDTVLILRCKEKTTEAAFSTKSNSAINLSMYNCVSTIKIQLKKSGRHQWMVGLRLHPMPSHSFSHCRTMENCR